jgi:hypothetical protein
MRPDIFLATIGRGSNGSNALEVTEDRATVTAESQDNIINRVNNISQYGPSWHYVPGIGVAGTAYAEVPGSALGDLAFSRASSKTRTNAAGLIQTIGNNVPPHDYRNADGSLSTFPRLNLEPQRTNRVLYSEQFDNAAWVKSAATVTANTTVSPDGSQNADTIAFTASAIAFCQQIVAGAFESQSHTVSVYAKVATGTATFRLKCTHGGVLDYFSSDFTATTTWQRFTFTATFGATIGTSIVCGVINGTNALAKNVIFYGFQTEANASYATSYIPTTTAAVTRIEDRASKAGVSSLIGQTEGTLFVDIIPTDVTITNAIGINNGSTAGRVIIFTGSNLIFGQVRVGAVTQFTINTSASVGVRYKAAIAYKANDFAFYLNGAQIAVSNTGTVPACSVISYESGGGLNPFVGGNNQAALFPTRLTNAQLAELTTL